MLITQGYDATIISLDKTPQGYLALRSAMNDKRIGLIHLDLLETELVQLQRDVSTGKLDHPADGSKDLSDSLAGALFNATLHKQDMIDSMQLFEASFDINEQADATAEFMSNFQQSLMQNNNSAIAASKLDELLNDFGGGNIISW